MKSAILNNSQFIELAKSISERYNVIELTETLMDLPGLLYDHICERGIDKSEPSFLFVASLSKAIFVLNIGERKSAIVDCGERLQEMFDIHGTKEADDSIKAVNASIFHYFSSVLVHRDEIEKLMHVISCLNEVNILFHNVKSLEQTQLA
ncbi:hypothetical protein [Flavihumibacter sp. CACIAM 22H1]|uniref:hypothetical protein n=1 Tax=Flavihumibacter sp. CACIAM 22H1 TaxID=1812911 RepID=UPI0007A85770|nr:hypothetical protein [Flavihumibacter sp. CACIAM 22H1]KYP16624.1 MAG: hypothetical protein A1D16_09435 [Flavihumibacter sp. CACIAM 22H1]